MKRETYAELEKLLEDFRAGLTRDNHTGYRFSLMGGVRGRTAKLKAIPKDSEKKYANRRELWDEIYGMLNESPATYAPDLEAPRQFNYPLTPVSGFVIRDPYSTRRIVAHSGLFFHDNIYVRIKGNDAPRFSLTGAIGNLVENIIDRHDTNTDSFKEWVEAQRERVAREKGQGNL